MQALLPLIEAQLKNSDIFADIFLADDGSGQASPPVWKDPGSNVKTIRVLKLHRNLGHQRAICIALCYLREQTSCARVLVMDGDGEDSPLDVPRLLSELERDDRVRIVFAERAKRSEGLVFLFFYAVYRVLHRLLVGQKVRVGNFSVMNRQCLESLCTSSELWNHYAASAFATRQPMAFVPTNRATRLAGDSHMNFSALVMHGLSAISVFSDRIGTRLLILSGFAAAAMMAGMVLVTVIRLTTGYAIPGWATNAFGVFAILLLQIATFMSIFCFLILFTRGFSPFVPVRDYRFFIRELEEVWRGRKC